MKIELEDKDILELYQNLHDIMSALEPLKCHNGELIDDVDVISTWIEDYNYEIHGFRISRAITSINKIRKLFKCV